MHKEYPSSTCVVHKEYPSSTCVVYKECPSNSCSVQGVSKQYMCSVQGVPEPCGFFFWTRFENLVAKGRKINDRVVPGPILVAIRNWLSRSEKVAEFAQCVAP